MLAVVKDRPGPGFTLREVDTPEPKDDEVLIKVKSVGICGSDIPIFKGIREVNLPLIPGHEFSGVIMQKGKNVSKFEEGESVVPGLVVHCGECDYCKQGLESLCDHIYEIGIHVDGAFAEYVVVPEKTLHRLPEKMSFNQGASIDPIASAYRVVRKVVITSRDVVAIFGPGPIGLYALQIAKAEGAFKIAVIGAMGDEQRLDLAKKLGADVIINGQTEDPVRAVREFTNGEMADVVIEATGAPNVIEPCLYSLRKNGRLGLAGIFHQPVAVPLGDIVRREFNIRGSICYTWIDFQDCIDLVSSERVAVEPLITYEFPLKDMAKALEMAYNRESIKIMLHPND
jgi:2-desacetyl-2-hydroxyethyl bacteriochlorophyllide A dehydrogenase